MYFQAVKRYTATDNSATYTIWVEKYTTFEIDVEEKFSFRSIANLHKHVCKMAAIIDEGAGIGKEMLGEAFDR